MLTVLATSLLRPFLPEEVFQPPGRIWHPHADLPMFSLMLGDELGVEAAVT